ncbi:hypothetical protein [Nostoc sp. FACHB-110]|nr:hypothetical protein [Nostoc sp. FACHB-110]
MVVGIANILISKPQAYKQNTYSHAGKRDRLIRGFDLVQQV